MSESSNYARLARAAEKYAQAVGRDNQRGTLGLDTADAMAERVDAYRELHDLLAVAAAAADTAGITL